jgi:hypothetical protein
MKKKPFHNSTVGKGKFINSTKTLKKTCTNTTNKPVLWCSTINQCQHTSPYQQINSLSNTFHNAKNEEDLIAPKEGGTQKRTSDKSTRKHSHYC